MSQSNDDLLWTAYRYSAGELSADESLRFEAKLADDQATREALASVVGLTETVCSIERESTPLRTAIMPAAVVRRTWLQTAGWIAVAAAACVALTLVWRGAEQPEQHTIVVAKVEAVDTDADLLLALLEEGREADEFAGEEDSVFIPRLTNFGSEGRNNDAVELALDEIQHGTEGDESGLDDPNATPDWILAAVAESKS